MLKNSSPPHDKSKTCYSTRNLIKKQFSFKIIENEIVYFENGKPANYQIQKKICKNNTQNHFLCTLTVTISILVHLAFFEKIDLSDAQAPPPNFGQDT